MSLRLKFSLFYAKYVEGSNIQELLYIHEEYKLSLRCRNVHNTHHIFVCVQLVLQYYRIFWDVRVPFSSFHLPFWKKKWKCLTNKTLPKLNKTYKINQYVCKYSAKFQRSAFKIMDGVDSTKQVPFVLFILGQIVIISVNIVFIIPLY